MEIVNSANSSWQLKTHDWCSALSYEVKTYEAEGTLTGCVQPRWTSMVNDGNLLETVQWGFDPSTPAVLPFPQGEFLCQHAESA